MVELLSGKKEQQNGLYKLLAEHPEAVSGGFASLEVSEKELHKHVMVEQVPFNLGRYLETGKTDGSGESLLIAYFQPDSGEEAQIYSMDLLRRISV